MQIQKIIQRIVAIGGVASLVCLVNSAQALVAPDTNVFNHFDTANDGSGVITNWYGQPSYLQWDGTKDAGGSIPGSGSLHVTANYAAADNFADGIAFEIGYQQFNGATNLIVGYSYTNLEFDIFWDTNSTIPLDTWNSTGDPQGVGIGLLTMPGVGQTALTNINTFIPQAASNAWVHMSIPIHRLKLAGVDQVMGLWFKKYYNGVLGTISYWIDNVKFDGADVLPNPGITQSSTSPISGLTFAGSTAGQYDRQNIITFDVGNSWLGNGATPVTFSANIVDYPGAGNANFIFHLFLVPGTSTGNSPDWNEANVTYLDIENNGDGTGVMIYRFKTNSPNSNGGFFGPNNPAQVNDPSVKGNWSVTYVSDTGVTLTSPSGNVTAFSLSATDVAAFGNPLEVFYGIMPNTGANIGQKMTLGAVGITNGGTTLLYKDFTTATSLDINVPGGFIYSTADATPTNAVYLSSAGTKSLVLSWPYPNGYNYLLQTNNVLDNAATWSTTHGYSAANVGVTKVVTIPKANLPNGGTSGNLFFRLVKP
jgi:hypothetical protein